MQIDRWFAISLSHLTLLLLCLGLSGVEYEEGEKSPTYADCRNLNRRYVCLTFVKKGNKFYMHGHGQPFVGEGVGV